jgi:hypothetical protein
MLYDSGFLNARTLSVAPSLRTKITTAKAFNKNLSAQTASGNGVLTFADIIGIAPGMSVANANIPAGSTVQSINAGAHTATILPVASGIVASGATIVFGIPALTGLTAVVDSIFARSPTQTLINYHIATTVGNVLNLGNLKTYANNLAAMFSTSTGLVHTVVSAIILGHRAEIAMLVTV